MSYGILTLFPAALTLVFAIVSRRAFEALMLGCLATYVIIGIANQESILALFTNGLFETLTDYDNIWLLIVCGLFGSIIALLNASGGANAIGRFLGRFCKTQNQTLLMSFVLGIIVFLDDYMNILTVSTCSRKLSDKRKIPREALAYVIDSTGAPVCVLLPFSTWAIFFGTMFLAEPGVAALGLTSVTQAYTYTIPFMFYAMAALVVVGLFAAGIMPKMGAMKKAYQRVEETGALYNERAARYNAEAESEAEEKRGNILDFVIPIAVLIAAVFILDDMFVAIALSITVCAVLYLPRKIMKFGEFCDHVTNGFASLIPVLFMMVGMFFLKHACVDIGLATYVIDLVEPYLVGAIFPVVSFIVVSILSFVTGDNWGVPGICVPIIIPLAIAADVNVFLAMATIVSAGTFSSHMCFYSDATVLTSAACGIDNMDHAITQIPYAAISFAVAAVAFLVAGFVVV